MHILSDAEDKIVHTWFKFTTIKRLGCMKRLNTMHNGSRIYSMHLVCVSTCVCMYVSANWPKINNSDQQQNAAIDDMTTRHRTILHGNIYACSLHGMHAWDVCVCVIWLYATYKCVTRERKRAQQPSESELAKRIKAQANARQYGKWQNANINETKAN